MNRRFAWPALLLAAAFLSGGTLKAQDGEKLYQANCAACHEANAESRAPGRASFQQMSPEQILTALESGAMKAQGAQRTVEERRSIAMFLSGKAFGSAPADRVPASAFCSIGQSSFQNTLTGPAWQGWGVDNANTRFQTAQAARMTADDVKKLKLKWAFGFPGETTASVQPAVVGGRVYVGSNTGKVYSLDAKTGCVAWIFEAEAGVRTAITIGSAGNELLAYFGDGKANVYAVNSATGKLTWKSSADAAPGHRITGAPALHAGRLYVAVTGTENGEPKYECCTTRGSVSVYEAATGKQVWKTFTVAGEPKPTRKNSYGTQLWGPSGAGIWSAPTIDAKRKLVYVATGNNYSLPATETSDAVIALDLETGKIRWTRQVTPDDTWNSACNVGRDTASCFDTDDPDFDFGSSPILTRRRDGREVIIAAQKSGIVYALDPDKDGEIVWQRRVARGGTRGGVEWGPAADDEKVYAAAGDAKRLTRDSLDPNAGGGLTALDLQTGEQRWHVPPAGCGDRKPCSPAQEAAVTAIPGVVFSGSLDGFLRAYSTQNGELLWSYDTAREFTSVNGVRAKGGSLGHGGPAVVDGMLFTNSGYANTMPGNVLLTFSIQ